MHRKVLEVVRIKLRRAALKRKDGFILLELYLLLLRKDIRGGRGGACTDCHTTPTLRP